MSFDLRFGLRVALFGLLSVSMPAVAADGVERLAKLQRADRIAADLESEGRVRIIVELAAPAPEGSDALLRADGEDRRAAQVAAILDSFVESTFGSGSSRTAAPKSVTRFALEPLLAFEADEQEIRRLDADGRVRSIHYDEVNVLAATRSTDLIGMPPVWAAGGDGQGQTVAIIDSGVDAGHPFLYPRVVAEACFSSTFRTKVDNIVVRFRPTCPGGRPVAVGRGAAAPCTGAANCVHGTHVAGIAAGFDPPHRGVAPRANIVAVQVFSIARLRGGTRIIGALTSDVMRGMEWVYRNRDTFGAPLAAVNMSLGGSPYTADRCDGDVRKRYVDLLRRAGVATVIASGNDGLRYEIAAPSCISTAVAVGASTMVDRIADFSNMSDFVDLMAPGVKILSSVPGGYARMSGTSMAAPHVAGAFAALRSLYPGASVDAIESRLEQTGVAITDTRKEGYYSKPRIDVDAARLALGRAKTPAQTPAGPATLSVIRVPAAVPLPGE